MPEEKRTTKKAAALKPAEVLTFVAHQLGGGIVCRIEILSTQTLLDLAHVLCNRVVSSMREHGDYGLDEHLWYFEVGAAGGSSKRVRWDKTKYVSDLFDELADDVLADSISIASLRLSESCKMRFVYDMGSPTNVPLTLERTGDMTLAEASLLPRAVEGGFGAVSWQARVSIVKSSPEWSQFLQGVPSHSTSPQDRVDAAFPRLAKAILSKKHAKVTLGRCNLVTDLDSLFLSIEHKYGNDVLLAPVPFNSLDELFTLAEKALTPDRSVSEYRESCVMNFLFPQQMSPEQEAKFKETKRRSDEDPLAEFRSIKRFHRLGAHDKMSESVSLSQLFPRTCAQMCSGKFRWFAFNPSNQTLQVIAGRVIVAQAHV
jgi:hypothetical protein